MQKNRKQITIKRKWFKTKEGGDIEEFFKFSKTKDVLLVVFSVIIKQILGTGTYGSVVKAIDKRTNYVRAIKVIPKSRVTKE